MKPPAGFTVKVYTLLIQLYADQHNLEIQYDLHYNGKSFRFDTRDPILSYKEIVKLYGKTEEEIQNEAENEAEIEAE
jgi:hypothetical protein